MNKRGFEPRTLFITAFIALVVVVVFIVIFSEETGEKIKSIKGIALEQKKEKCQQLQQQAVREKTGDPRHGFRLPDDDSDGFPNICDICPGFTSAYDDKKDRDGDGIPDACDKNPRISGSTEDCLLGWDNLRERCNPPVSQ